MIGIFDSGYGGLTIMKDIVKLLPEYDYIYLGDNARTPYGNRSKEMVTQFTRESVEFLFERGAQLIIVACFTASALALREVQEEFLGRKILGVIRPVVEYAASHTKSGRIGVAATRGTVNSKSFEIEIKNIRPQTAVVQQACPLLVPFIEEEWHTKPEARMILKKYLLPLKTHNLDMLLLGCTHYPHMIKDFKRVMGKRVEVLDSGEIVAQSLCNYLERHPEIEKKLSKKGRRSFCTTEDAERFSSFMKRFGGSELAKNIHAEKVIL